MTITGIIPARYASSRFPGKLLEPLDGRPILQHVVEKCRLAKRLADVIVATDDQRIVDALADICRVEMTREDHPSGTDRVAEVVQRCELGAVLNVQGDEPMIDPGVIDAVAARLDDSEMSTAAVPIRQPEEWGDPNAVKVVVNASGQALYFSRRTIPYLRDAAACSRHGAVGGVSFLKHLGIYGYRRETLLRLVECPVSPLEEAEKTGAVAGSRQRHPDRRCGGGPRQRGHRHPGGSRAGAQTI